MFGSVFLKLSRFPAFRRFIWKPIYNMLARVITTPDWRFMNYGYMPTPAEKPVHLEPQDENERYPAQLYHYLATRTDIMNKDVLEVGSGRGGGAYHVARYLKPNKMVGMDLADNAVRFATKNMTAPGLMYVQGNAESLPFPDDSFDVVLNVESSHAYGSFSRFVSEVKRVLRPGGTFLITDMRNQEDLEVMKRSLAASGMLISEETDITHNVVEAMEADDQVKSRRVNESVPSWLSPAFREFAGMTNSAIHLHLKNRERLYYIWKLEKQTA